MATLTVTQDTDYRGGPAETDITDIVFQAPNPGTSLKATFDPGQFGPGLVSDTVTVTDDPGHANTFIEVEFAGAGSFSAAGWTFVDWEDGDQIYIFGTADAQTITGSSHDDRIGGYGGVDQIDAGGGDDSILTTFGVAAGSTIEGGAGFDTLQVGQTRDLTAVDISGVERLFFEVATTTVILNGDQIGAGGISEIDGQWSQTGAIEVEGDTVDLSAVSFLDWGSDDSVSIRGTSTFSNALTGSSQADTISGSGGSIDFMTGGGGADTLEGGDGPDAFIYYSGAELSAGELIDGGAGADAFALIDAGSIDFGAATHVGVETVDFISGSSTAMLTSIQVGTLRVTAISGSSSADHLVVTAVSEFANLSGLSFADWTAGTDTITVNGSDLGDYLLGSSQPDTIFGEEGGDRIDGGAGADAMLGGNDNDTYLIDNAGDTASESGGSGTDEVQSTISFLIRTDVENLTLLGAGAINGTGNVSDNTITGNSAANTLTAFGGADRLDGGGGADTLIGGNGNDTYVVDNAGDTASEVSGSGVDLVQSAVSFTLGSGIENLTLTGTAVINGTGNGAGNAITGNSVGNVLSGLGGDDTFTGFGGADRLDGGAGADTMSGGNGNDTYVVENAGDTADESSGSGTDTVSSTVSFTLAAGIEILVLNGTAAINGTGNASANTLYGNSTVNRLDGNAGDDTMTGFGGADVFVFDDGDGADTITDFANGADKLDLTAVAGVGAFSDLVLTDTGAGVEVDYGTGSFELANVANLASIDASDFIFA